ncbi:MAG: hypothetical protein FJX23_01620 [Alphaproteobacteria bacterium]|nr:hypothetical protein [Alphaproteobacteria bacterium]
MKSILTLAAITLAFLIGLFTTVALAAEKKEVVFGATVGDFSDIITESVKPQLEAKGYTVKLIQFTDYVQPNIALAEKRLDANLFQHKPYLDQFIAQKGLKLSPLVTVPTAPLGLYAGKKKTIEEVEQGSTVAVPNDPSNLARALLILKDLGWIEIPEDVDALTVSPKDITKNVKAIKIVQLEAAQLPRAVQDVDYAVINGNYVVSSGLKLTDALVREKSRAYLNWVVVRSEDKDGQFAKDVTAALQSPEFKAYASKKFAGYKFPEAW